LQGNENKEGDFPFILNSKSYQDLKIRVKKAIPYQFATWGWWIKATLIFGLAVFLEFEALLSGPSILKASVLGVVMAMIGLCVQHDANHGAVSPNGWVNRLWGYTQVAERIDV
jgi:fatty acid desaturase